MRVVATAVAACVAFGYTGTADAFNRDEHRAIANGGLYLAIMEVSRYEPRLGSAADFIAAACQYLPPELAAEVVNALSAQEVPTIDGSTTIKCAGARDGQPTFGDISACVDNLTDPVQLLHWTPRHAAIASTCDNPLKEFARATDNETHFQQSAVDSFNTHHQASRSIVASKGNWDMALRQAAIASHYLADLFAPGHLAARRIEINDAVALSRHDFVNGQGAHFSPSCRMVAPLDAILARPSHELSALAIGYGRPSRFPVGIPFGRENVSALFRNADDGRVALLSLRNVLADCGSADLLAPKPRSILFRGDGRLIAEDAHAEDAREQRALLVILIELAILGLHERAPAGSHPDGEDVGSSRGPWWSNAPLADGRVDLRPIRVAGDARCGIEFDGIGRFEDLPYLDCAARGSDTGDDVVWDTKPRWFEIVPQISLSTVTTTSASAFNTYLLQFEPARFFSPWAGENLWLSLGWAVAAKEKNVSWIGHGPQIRITFGIPAIKTSIGLYARHLHFSPKHDAADHPQWYDTENLAFNVRAVGVRLDYGFTDTITVFGTFQRDNWNARSPYGDTFTGFWGESLGVGVSFAFPANRLLPFGN